MATSHSSSSSNSSIAWQAWSSSSSTSCLSTVITAGMSERNAGYKGEGGREREGKNEWREGEEEEGGRK